MSNLLPDKIKLFRKPFYNCSVFTPETWVPGFSDYDKETLCVSNRLLVFFLSFGMNLGWTSVFNHLS